MTEMTPPHIHIHLEVLFREGKLLISTVGDPGVQGAAVAGIQGIGVSTPSAAVVAAATVGLASDEQTPKGRMLAIGTWSIMVAAKGPPAIVGGPLGITNKELGATPNVHCKVAPIQT